MMDPEFVKWLLTLGVGGVLAGFMFVFYRKDMQQYTELWRVTAEQLMKVTQENTISNVRILAMLENIERNSKRKEDLLRHTLSQMGKGIPDSLKDM